MARPREFKVAAIADLFQQIRFASHDARLRQMRAAEKLTRDIDPDQHYPEEFIIFRVTGYRPDGSTEGLVVGQALLGDLATFVQRISATLDLSESHDGHHALTLEEAAARLGVTVRTLQRYRQQGLLCHEVVLKGGERRLICFDALLEQFAARHGLKLDGKQTFTRTSRHTQQEMIEQARQLRSDEQVTLHLAAKRIAKQYGRAVETVRSILQKHDAASDTPIFIERGPITEREQRAIERAYRIGVAAADLATHYRRSQKTIYRVLLQRRLRYLRSHPIRFIELPTFALPDADDVLLRPAVVCSRLRNPPPSSDAVTILERAKSESTVHPDGEAALLAAYNYLKRRARKRLDRAVEAPLKADGLDAIETDLLWAALLKRVLVHHAMPIAITTIERSITRPLLSQSADEIGRFVPLAAQVVSECIETVDPSRGQLIERVCSFAMDRRMARLHFTPSARRAAARHRVTELIIDDPLSHLSPWQAGLDIPDSLAGRVHRLAARDGDLLVRRYGLDGSPPLTCAALADQLRTSSSGVRRRIRRATLNLKRIAARDRHRER